MPPEPQYASWGHGLTVPRPPASPARWNASPGGEERICKLFLPSWESRGDSTHFFWGSPTMNGHSFVPNHDEES